MEPNRKSPGNSGETSSESGIVVSNMIIATVVPQSTHPADRCTIQDSYTCECNVGDLGGGVSQGSSDV